jgi:hypothetical protein
MKPNPEPQYDTALIGQCDGCGMVTAIDMVPTPENFKVMRHPGRTIRTVSKAVALEMWKRAGKCKCTG